MSCEVSVAVPWKQLNMSCACRGLPCLHASLCNLSTSLEPWLRWSKETAIRPLGCLEDVRAFQARIAEAAMGDIVSLVWRRGWRSHRQAIEGIEGGSSERPWTVTRMPAMVNVCVEMVGWLAGCVPWSGLFVAAIVKFQYECESSRALNWRCKRGKMVDGGVRESFGGTN